MSFQAISMTGPEMAYLRHKAWHIGYTHPKARRIERNDLFTTVEYVFMSGIEQAKLIDILLAYRREISL
jgi:hypothetical protein